MQRTLSLVVATVLFCFSLPALADLQEVKVGGSLRIRGNWYSEQSSPLTFDKDLQSDQLFVEQRTRVNVSATFTDDVNAFIELDSYNVFGDTFRGLDGSDGLYGVDNGSGTAVNFYQGYIEVKDLWGTPISMRVGRQEIQLGSEFLVGNNDTGSRFRGLSFDGITLSSHFGDFKLRSWYTELVTNNNPLRLESSGDIWFHGMQGSYDGFENMTIEVYAIHYAQALTGPLASAGFISAMDFYTLGARFAGTRSHFDWDVEGAYQLGDSGRADVPGVSSEDVNAYAITGKAGYTFDVRMQPRLFVNGVYLSGDDEGRAFNRLFSDHEYSQFIDSTDMSNVWLLGGGVGAQVTESIGLAVEATYFQAVEDFGAADNNVGVEAAVSATYRYSEDLSFTAGYAHFFAGSGVEDGLRISASGATSIGGSGQSDDLDYVFLETSISF